MVAPPSKSAEPLPEPLQNAVGTGGDPREHVDSLDYDRTRAALRSRLFGEAPKPTTVGRFVIVSSAGTGEMGRVYVAYDPSLDRKVALKLVRADDPDEPDRAARRERLVREAQAIARLAHPNVIAVYEVGSLDDEVFFAMEYVQGRSLGHWIRAERPSWREVVDAFVQAARGLAAAHARGLVHRDFKPDNVLVGEDGRVRVLDFGLARLYSAEPTLPNVHSSVDAPSAARTRTGALMGTPAYMAPEQYLSGQADERSDQFSFFVALHEALAGQRPFAARGRDELIERFRKGAPPIRGIPAWLQSMLERGLRFEPDQRHPSMNTVVAELSRDPSARRRLVGMAVVLGSGAVGGTWLVSQGADTGPSCAAASEELESAWNDTRRANARAAFEATGLHYATDVWTRVERVLELYASEWTHAREELCRTEGERADDSKLVELGRACLADRLRELDATLGMFEEPSEQVVKRAPNAARSLSRIADCKQAERLLAQSRPTADPTAGSRLKTIEARIAEVKALHRAAAYSQALPIATNAVSASEALGDRPLLADAVHWLGLVEKPLNEPERAERRFRDAASLAEASHHDTRAAQAWLELALIAANRATDDRWPLFVERATAAVARLGDPPRLVAKLEKVRGYRAITEGTYSEALAHFQTQLGIVDDGTEAGMLAAANARFDVGNAQWRLARHADAGRSLTDAVQALETTHGPEHPRVGRALERLGNVLASDGRFEQAESVLRRALQIDQRSLGPEHPSTGMSWMALGNLFYHRGDHDRALEAYKEALRVLSRDQGHKTFPLVVQNIGLTLSALRRHEEALAHLRRGLEISSIAYGPNHPRVAEVASSLGAAYANAGDLAQSASFHQRAVEARKKSLGPDNLVTGESHGSLGDVLREMGRLSDAEPHAERAVAVIEAALGPEHPKLAVALARLGRLRLQMNRPEPAIDALEPAVSIFAEHGGHPFNHAEAKFRYAKALVAAGRGYDRALALANEARDLLTPHGDLQSRKLEAIEKSIAEWTDASRE